MQHRVVFRGIVMLVTLLHVAVARGAGPATVPAGPGDPPGSGRIGKFGDLRTLPIEGARVIPADVVRRALSQDWATQVVLAPSSPVEQFVSVIVERARGAYLNSGFVAPRVSMRLDEAKNPVALVVEEGKRYRRGKVRFVGATRIPVDVLVTDLTTPPAPPPARTPFKIDLNVAAATARIDGCDTDPPAESARPFWSRELWASFHPNWRAVAEDRVRRALASRGFFQTKFTIEIAPGPAEEADLIVRVTEDGRPARLSGIDLSGLKRNTRETVVAVMGLKEDGPIDLNAMLVAQQALWDTGRFRKHAMRLQQDNEGIELGNARLKLDLDEHPTLPLLGEELSPAQQAMLRFGAWMERFDERGDELAAVANGTGLRMEIVLSARGSWLVHAHEPVAAATRPANAESTRGPSTASSRRSAALDHAFAATNDRVTLFDPAHARRAELGAFARLVTPRVAIHAVPMFDQPEGRWQTFIVGGGVTANDKEGRSAPARPSLRFVLAPVVLLGVMEEESAALPTSGPTTTPTPVATTTPKSSATRPVVRPTLEDGVLAARLGDYATLRIDAATGALLGIVLDQQGITADVTVAPAGRLAQMLERLDARATDAVRVGAADSLRPTIEMMAGLVESIPVSDEWREKLRPFANLGPASAPLAVLLGPIVAEVTAEVRIPASGAATQPDLTLTMAPPKLDPGATNPLFLAATFGAMLADATAPRGSWAWTVLRESFLLKAGEFRSAGREMERLSREKRVGPVAALAVAISPLAGRQTAANFARQAMALPEPAALVDDLRFLIDGQTPLSRGVLASAEQLRAMSDADVRAIAAALPPRAGRAFERVAEQLKRRKGDPADRALLDAFASLWPTHLRDPIMLALDSVANRR